MQNGNKGFGGMRWRSLMVAAVALAGTLWTSAARATITQGDFSVFGFFETREAGRWGEGSSSIDSTPTKLIHPTPSSTFALPGQAFGHNGGSFDFNHWDLVEQRNLADIRPDYHMIKNYKLLGRFDTLFIKDGDFFAFYRPWYDSIGSIKNFGRANPNTDRIPYTQNTYALGLVPANNIQQEYFKDDLREYYAQLNFTDNLSVRIGKQQVIWSEADALSGTEVTNPVNAQWHGVYGAEAAEDTRTNLRMIKANYILPDYFHTANNELEAFIIPGDFEGAGVLTQTDPRNPWAVPATFDGGCHFCSGADEIFPVNINQEGQVYNASELPNFDSKAMIFIPIGPKVGKKTSGEFFDFQAPTIGRTPSNSLENSEFGTRLSSLLPIGNGLQVSLIYLYEFRSSRTEDCYWCPASSTGVPGSIAIAPGTFIAPGYYTHGKPRPGVPKAGTLFAPATVDYRRNSFFGVTGTYYDKDLTDIVYRYDVLYQPDIGVGVPTAIAPQGSEWTEFSRFIIAGDRPTYIPWLSKQHTFITAQYTMTWYPDRPTDATPIVTNGGKVRELSSLAFISFTNWLMNGQLTAGNTLLWDIDDNVGELSTTNVYRYSRNILFGVNAEWFLGQSGRFTDPYLLSREQRFNELEFTFTYEI
jgi:uncharacterized protein DUF1302